MPAQIYRQQVSRTCNKPKPTTTTLSINYTAAVQFSSDLVTAAAVVGLSTLHCCGNSSTAQLRMVCLRMACCVCERLISSASLLLNYDLMSLLLWDNAGPLLL